MLSHTPKFSGRNGFKIFYKLCRGCFGESDLLHSLSLDLANNTSTLDGKTRRRNRKFLNIPNVFKFPAFFQYKICFSKIIIKIK